MTDLGVTELGRARIIRAAYDAVGIITFFTAGEPEVRGWNLETGSQRRRGRRQDPHRPGQGIHPGRGHRLRRQHAAGTLKEAKAKHLVRLEGKDYVVKDGDIIYFRSAL